jgi:hypothetical protein
MKTINIGGEEMKTFGAVIIGGILLLAVFGVAFSNFSGFGHVQACGGGWGAPGGGNYVPQGRAPSSSYMNRAPAVTQEQAQKLVANHVRKLNPDLKIGRLQDAGSYYEAEVLGANGDVVQRLGVDKQSGQLISIN